VREGRSEITGTCIGPKGFKTSEVDVVRSPSERVNEFVVQDKLRISIPSLTKQMWMEIDRFHDENAISRSPPSCHAVALRGASPQNTKRQAFQQRKG